MAIKRIDEAISFNVQEMIGLSTDIKPINITTGSKFTELDTKNVYIFDGTSWYNTSIVVSSTQISTDKNIVFSNNATTNTQQTITFTKPTSVLSEYKIVVWNPSTVTDLTVKVMDVDATNGDSLITTLNIPKKQTITGTNVQAYTNLVHGIFVGSDCKLVLSNDSALGSSDGFTAIVRVREVI